MKLSLFWRARVHASRVRAWAERLTGCSSSTGGAGFYCMMEGARPREPSVLWRHQPAPSRLVNRPAGQSGQVMVFLVLALVIVTLLVLWNFDLHTILHLKSRTQNAGDAAALAAARWQGITLNLIGDLNIMQAVALTGGDTNAAAQIADMQARLRYAGPLTALLAAQQAAKHNGIYASAVFSAYLHEHAQDVRDDYAVLFAEPWPGCWETYADVLEAIAGEGLAAAPDNTRRYNDYNGPHVLLDPSFYDAVGGRDWCWFHWNDIALLSFYTDYTWWDALPPRVPTDTPAESEVFGLGLDTMTAILPGGTALITNMNDLAAERALSATAITTSALDYASSWTVYNSRRWAAWEALAASNDFPIRPLEPRPEYDYVGADAVVRIVAEVARRTPGAGGSVVNWTAAAKPFGYLETDSGPERPNYAGLALPAFRHARLVPADAASGPVGGAYDLDWRAHTDVHLPLYLQNGLAGLEDDCWYCQQLRVWEDAVFREAGLDWLEATDDEGELLHPCRIYTGPGGPGGGTRRGH